MSDTWSTDVLASDSELVEQQERFPFLPPADQPPPPPLAPEPVHVNLDASETTSEAWSTDVLASDSERITEVDTDDTASVARYSLTRCLSVNRSHWMKNTISLTTESFSDRTTRQGQRSKAAENQRAKTHRHPLTIVSKKFSKSLF